MVSKKYIPLIVIICIIAIPITFLFCINLHFKIVNFTDFKINDFKKLIDFVSIIFENIGKRKLKQEIWSSFIYSLIPIFVLIALFFKQ